MCFYVIYQYSLLLTLLSLPEGLLKKVHCSPFEREACFLRFTFQRLGDLIYIPHLPAHAVLTLDKGSPTILTEWDAVTTTNPQIITITLDEYTFGVRRGEWREIFRKKGLSALREWVFSPSTGPQESKDKLKKHWKYWKLHSPNFLSSLQIEKEVPRKIKRNRVSPVQSSELRYTHKGAIGPGSST